MQDAARWVAPALFRVPAACPSCRCSCLRLHIPSPVRATPRSPEPPRALPLLLLQRGGRGGAAPGGGLGVAQQRKGRPRLQQRQLQQAGSGGRGGSGGAGSGRCCGAGAARPRRRLMLLRAGLAQFCAGLSACPCQVKRAGSVFDQRGRRPCGTARRRRCILQRPRRSQVRDSRLPAASEASCAQLCMLNGQTARLAHVGAPHGHKG